MQGIKAIADRYKISKLLFKVNSYVYAKSTLYLTAIVFDKYTLNTVIGCVYIYENQEPGQILKMLLEKFSLTSNSKMSCLIFPESHIKDQLQDKSVSLFFMQHQLVSLACLPPKEIESISNVNQMLKVTYDALCGLHYLHSHDIVHGNISLNTCYLVKNESKDINFALNILDTSIFHQETLKSQQSLFFRSESQQNGLKNSYKDDAESIIYVIIHLMSKGKMFTKQRYQIQWQKSHQLTKWKSSEFYKQMINVCPKQLQFIVQMYVIIKSLSRNQKPDYPKFIKKAYSKLKQVQNKEINNKDQQYTNSNSCNSVVQNENHKQISNKIDDNKIKIQRQKNKNSIQFGNKALQKIQDQQQQNLLMMIEDQEQENQGGLNSKYSKLQKTKCTVKNKVFWQQNTKQSK